jgi:UDP-N-acetylglucosamine:LPS N-acetylglucosamine transferase
VPDAELNVAQVRAFTQVLTDPQAHEAMAQAAASTGVRDGAARLADLVRQVAGTGDRVAGSEEKSDDDAA